MSTIFAQPPITRGRRKSRGVYQGSGNRGESPHVARKSVGEDPSTVLRHLVAHGAPENPQFDEPTAYYAEKIVENKRRPPSRQGFRAGDPFSAYMEDFLLDARLEDEFANPFASIFDPNIRFDDHQGAGLTEGKNDNNPQKQKYDPYLPPQLFSPNFSFSDLPPPPQNTTKTKHSLYIDPATLELLSLADAHLPNHFSRVTLSSGQHQTPQPRTPPGLSPPKIPTHRPREYAPPAVAPPAVPCSPGPIQRPKGRPLPHAPTPCHQVPAPSVERPILPPGLGPFTHEHGPSPAWADHEVPPLYPLPHILPEMLQGHPRELDAYLNGVRDMFMDYHRAKRLSACATRGARPGGITGVNLSLSRGTGTAAVVPTHFNPIRCVSGAEVWLNVIADHLDELRIGKRTSKADRKPHYLSMVFASYSGIVRPPRVASPFLLRIETD